MTPKTQIKIRKIDMDCLIISMFFVVFIVNILNNLIYIKTLNTNPPSLFLVLNLVCFVPSVLILLLALLDLTKTYKVQVEEVKK